jgi:transglutaminase-like putative cysteine protease
MPQLYRILTAVLAFTGCVSLVISGEVNPIMSLTGIGLFPGYYRFLKGMPQAPGWAIGGFSVLTFLIFFFDTLIVSNDYFLGVAHLTMTFQAIKSFDLKEPWDHLQVYFMALLQLIIASELTQSVAFGAVFILFLVTLVTAMVLAHFMKDVDYSINVLKEGTILKIDIKKPVVYISFLTLLVTVVFFVSTLVTVVFFVSTPRVSGGVWGKSRIKRIKNAGFSEKVNLGSFGELKLDPTVVMRIELNPMIPGPYYWRGMTLDYFDGTSWNSTLIDTRRSVRRTDDEFVVQPSSGTSVIQKIMLEPIDSDVIFGLDRVISIKGDFIRLEKNPAASLFVHRRGARRLQYVVRSDIVTTTQSTDFGLWKRYLNIPDFLRDKIKAFTGNVLRSEGTKPVSDHQKASTIERYLKKNYRYSLNVNLPDDNINPVLYFLFESKAGYCEHYATAMTMMLRSAGIPSRVVTGFFGGELNEYGDYIIVRQSDAHSWVEAVIDGRWKRFDPTPSVLIERPSALVLYIDMLRMKWERYVVAFSLSDQKEIVKTVSMPFRLPLMPDFRPRGFYGVIYVLLPLSGIVLMLFLLRHLRFKRYGFVTAQYLKLRNIVKNKGAEISPSSTPSEVKQEAVNLGMDGRIEDFLKLYKKHRFGGKEMIGEDRVRYRNLIKEIKRQL